MAQVRFVNFSNLKKKDKLASEKFFAINFVQSVGLAF